MKNSILILCIGCNRKEVTKQEKKATTIPTLVKDKEIVVNENKEVENVSKKNTQIKNDSQICKFIDSSKILFKEKMTREEIILKNKLSPGFYKGSEDFNIKNLLKFNDVVCIGYTRAETLSIYKINYNSKEESLKVYENLKQIKDEEKYHDFFKRGLVFILEENSIIMIPFNAYTSYNKLFKRMKKYLLENKEKYDKVLLCHSITSVEELIP